MAIDVGSYCSNLNAILSTDRTAIQLENGANADGTINQIDAWANSNISTCIVGMFVLSSGTSYTQPDGRRSHETVGDRDLAFTAGSCVTLNAPGDFTAFSVETGDYVGINSDAGNLERNSSGGTDAQDFDNGAANFGSTVSYAVGDDQLAIQAYGTEAAAGISIPVAMHHMTKNIGR